MTSADALKVHLVEAHSQSLYASDVEKLVQMGARKVAQVSEATCPLCREKLTSAKKYMRHVGRHQEELALFALPRLEVPGTHGQKEDESIPDELDLERDDFWAESQPSDEDEHAQESLEYPSQKDENSSFDMPTRSSTVPPDFASHTTSEITTNEMYVTDLYGSDNDHKDLRHRKPEIRAGHGEEKDQQQIELSKEAEEHPSDDGGIGNSHNHHQRGRPRVESHISSYSHRRSSHSSHSSSRSPVHEGSDVYPTMEPNETKSKLDSISPELLSELKTIITEEVENLEESQKLSIRQGRRAKHTAKLDDEVEFRHRLRTQPLASGLPESQIKAILDKPGAKVPSMDPAPVEAEVAEKTTYTRMSRRHVSIEALRVRGIEWELDANLDYIMIKRWVSPEEQKELWSLTRVIRDNREKNYTERPNVVTPGRRFDGPVAVSKTGRKSYAERPYVEPLGPAAARPTVAVPTSPNIVSPGRRFDGPVTVSKTSQPAVFRPQAPTYSELRSGGMERPTVFYKYDGVESPSAVYEGGNYYPHPSDQAPDQSQRAQQPTGIDEPADNDREKRHSAVPHNQDPADCSGPHSTRSMERPTVFYKYDGAKSPTAGYEDGNYYPHPLSQAPDKSQKAQQPTSSDQLPEDDRD